MSRPYAIAGLAAAAGVHVETIRHYQRLKLVPEPPRPMGSIRRYTEADAHRLRFIKRAQAMGFTLTEITSLITLQARRSCRATRELAATKLRLVDARIRGQPSRDPVSIAGAIGAPLGVAVGMALFYFVPKVRRKSGST